MASGTPWLGIVVERAVRILIIENEGPRGKFRRKLLQKFATWNGHPAFNDNVRVMEDPWTMFSLREETHRHALAVSIATNEIDLVVMGPLVTLGMVGGGTPDEVQDFETLLRMTRALVPRPFAFWTVHHENKAGDVAGAWERVPDCLMHVQAQGNGHTRVVFRKARWADESHGKSMDLRWIVEGRSYEIKAPDDRDLHADLIAAFTDDDAWRTAKEACKLINANEAKVRDALSDLVERHEMKFAVGPPGRGATAKCYRMAEGDPSLLDHPGSPDLSATPTRGGDPGDPPVSRDGRSTDQITPPTAGGDPALAHPGSPFNEDDVSEPSF
jgi:hypothetical protein